MLNHDQILTTPKGIAQYPYLVEPDEFEGALDYKVNLILDPADNGVQEFIDSVQETAEKVHADTVEAMTKKGGKNAAKAKEMEVYVPIEAEYDEAGEETGRFILKAKSKAQGVNAKGKQWSRKIPIFDCGGPNRPPKQYKHGSVAVWSGSVLKVEVKTNCFDAPGLKLAGVSFYINAVQLLEASGGSAGGGFGVEEGTNYEGDEGDTEDFGPETPPTTAYEGDPDF